MLKNFIIFMSYNHSHTKKKNFVQSVTTVLCLTMIEGTFVTLLYMVIGLFLRIIN